MPATLVDDATAWLRAQGAPMTARNLNAAQAYLVENPDKRPSYATSADDPTGELTFADGETMQLDTGEGVDPVIPQRKPTQGMQPRIPGRKPPTPASNVDASVPQMKGDARGEPNPLYVEEPAAEETGTSPDDGTDIAGIATGVGAGVGGAAALSAELKRAYDSGMQDADIRNRFAKNIGSRVANATRGSSESGALPKGVRPELQPYQISALDGALTSIRDGDMTAAEKWLTYLSPEDQKALRSTLAQTPDAARRAPTMAQRATMGGVGLAQQIGDVLRKAIRK